MRKAFTLIEILTVLAVISIIAIPMARLSTATIADIPLVYRMAQSNASMLDAIRHIGEDVGVAKGFPKSSGGYKEDDTHLLIESRNGTICYQLTDSKIIRRRLANISTGNSEQVISWTVPLAKISWGVWRENNNGYAVEVRTCLEQESGERTMENSHVYFAGIYKEALN
jgi:prepilin-type N-terminal cleavage/methylation domain-containing protein